MLSSGGKGQFNGKTKHVSQFLSHDNGMSAHKEHFVIGKILRGGEGNRIRDTSRNQGTRREVAGLYLRCTGE